MTAGTPRASKQVVVSATVDSSKAGAFDEDAILVDRFLAGDEAAFELLYRKYYEKVFAVARGILLHSEEAADAVQEIFTLVYRNLKRFDRRSRFSTWLFRIAVNRSIQEARRSRFRYKSVELTEALGGTTGNEDPAYDDPKIDLAMSRMQPADRALLVLFYWEELSLTEIAASLGCGVNAAKTRLYRARERFRSIYEEATP